MIATALSVGHDTTPGPAYLGPGLAKWVQREIAAFLTCGRAGSITLHYDGKLIRQVDRSERFRGGEE